MSTTDVIIGGAITLGGTVVTQVVAFAIAHMQRRGTTKAAVAEYEQQALEDLQSAAKAYRICLTDYNAALQQGNDPADDVQRSFQDARMDFQATLFKVPTTVTKRLEAWEAIAVQWSQTEGSAAEEDRLWAEAMRVCGRHVRAAVRER